jgi:uncharacterized protein YbbK (DUF523 family)
MNRESSHKVYLNYNGETEGWLQLFRGEDYWLHDVTFLELEGFAELLELGIDYVKTVVIWDTEVPASLNVACTVAGVEDGVVMTEEYYAKYQDMLKDKPVIDLVGMFDGTETGSAKNDAYRWAIENYLLTGKCSTDYICSYIDGWSFRAAGNNSYTVVRDWGIYHRAFVYDLSPWGDEAPLDDPEQSKGLDKDIIEKLKAKHTLIPACPEQLGGLTTPRNPSERIGEKVMMDSGEDVTEQYRRGAEQALYLARLFRCEAAILKERSPSCGCGEIYDGTFSGSLREGDGVTAELFQAAGIPVYGESRAEELL